MAEETLPFPTKDSASWKKKDYEVLFLKYEGTDIQVSFE
jgi:hypothetical protein